MYSQSSTANNPVEEFDINLFLTGNKMLNVASYWGTAEGRAKNCLVQDFHYVKPIGHGTYGMVHLFAQGSRLWAVKFFVTNVLDQHKPTARDNANAELKAICHPRLQDLPADSPFCALAAWGNLAVRIPGYIVGRFLVSEFCELGNAEHVITRLLVARVLMPEPILWNWLFTIARAAEDLTRELTDEEGNEIRPLLHMDVKLNNLFIYLDKNGMPTLKLGDWGCAEEIEQGASHVLSYKTIPPYNAPQWPRHCERSQLWSLVHCVYMVASFGMARVRDLPQNAHTNDPFSVAYQHSHFVTDKAHPQGGIVVHYLPDYSSELNLMFRWVLGEVDRQDQRMPGVYHCMLKATALRAPINKPWSLPASIFGEALSGGESS